METEVYRPPIILAMLMNTAFHQQEEKFVDKNGRQPSPEEKEQIKEWTLQTVIGRKRSI
ncbi:hypothetical protein [Bacillus sp. EB600]|uniref:hypothetical protein n=1 Tax=Bacillus sp. EB600 TaxID=2806345 RepID=UPI00210A3240|nr:hypothetical protein [Bacillus sp. EB600]MCQ6279945.1 hypothetical protein [Bacillus sp. EB600]